MLMMRWAEEIEDRQLFEPVPGRFVLNEGGYSELLVRGERYVFRPGVLWGSLTDPRTSESRNDSSERSLELHLAHVH